MTVVLPLVLDGQKLTKGVGFPKTIASDSKQFLELQLSGIPAGVIAKAYFKQSWDAEKNIYDETFNNGSLIIPEYVTTLPEEISGYVDYVVSVSVTLFGRDEERGNTNPIEVVLEKPNYSSYTANSPELPPSQYEQFVGEVLNSFVVDDALNGESTNPVQNKVVTKKIYQNFDQLNDGLTNHENRLKTAEKSISVVGQEMKNVSHYVDTLQTQMSTIGPLARNNEGRLGVIEPKVTALEEAVEELQESAVEGAVLYTEQELTEEQKAQARKNIGATTEIEDGSVTPEKTSFVKSVRVPTSPNLLDKDTVVPGYRYMATDGKPALNSNANTTKYGAMTCRVAGLTQVNVSINWGAKLYNYFFTDEADNILTTAAPNISCNITAGGYTMSVPDGATKLYASIISYTDAAASNRFLMVVSGNTAMEYQPYSYVDRIIIPNLHVEGMEVEDNREMRLCLPEKYDLVVGDTFELFYKGIMLCKDPYQYNVLVTCNIGNAYRRKFIVTPTDDDVGAHKLTVTVTDDFGTVLANKSVSLNVVKKATSPTENINVLCVGDSLTEGGKWVDEVYRRLTKTTDKAQDNAAAPTGDGLTNITFVGKKTTPNGAGFEGTGGWKYDYYIDPAKSGNPFVYNGAVDFNAYCADLGIDHIDLCYILLGWNMVSNSEDEFKTKAKAFIDLLIAHNPNIKIVLIGIQMPFLDGLGYNYGAKGVYADYRGLQEFVMNLDDWNKDLATEYDNNITSINISGQFDTEYGTWTREVAVNTRNTIKLTEQFNGIHPKEEGYYQIADAVYRKFMADNQ